MQNLKSCWNVKSFHGKRQRHTCKLISPVKMKSKLVSENFSETLHYSGSAADAIKCNILTSLLSTVCFFSLAFDETGNRIRFSVESLTLYSFTEEYVGSCCCCKLFAYVSSSTLGRGHRCWYYWCRQHLCKAGNITQSNKQI